MVELLERNDNLRAGAMECARNPRNVGQVGRSGCHQARCIGELTRWLIVAASNVTAAMRGRGRSGVLKSRRLLLPRSTVLCTSSATKPCRVESSVVADAVLCSPSPGQGNADCGPLLRVKCARGASAEPVCAIGRDEGRGGVRWVMRRWHGGGNL